LDVALPKLKRISSWPYFARNLASNWLIPCSGGTCYYYINISCCIPKPLWFNTSLWQHYSHCSCISLSYNTNLYSISHSHSLYIALFSSLF
jgi:hypothetical protein